MLRKIDIEFNKFPTTPPSKLREGPTSGYINCVQVDLFKLAAQYKIEEFEDFDTPQYYDEYWALKYLLPSTDSFKFSTGQPGGSKDSRKENSRVLGQTFCRYFNYHFLDAPYTAHISTFIGKKLGSEFSSVEIKRKESGDTPDFISATTAKVIFLSEAKGRRKIVQFGDDDFVKWRKQFDRISIVLGKREMSVKGYILEFAIANENNRLKNSKILIEDPKTSGGSFDQNQELFDLVKCGHYKEILDKLGLGFIGEALIYGDKINSSRFTIPVFTSKSSDIEYVGAFSGPKGYNMIFDFPFISERAFFRYLKSHSKSFFGLRKSILKQLIDIARGNFERLGDIKAEEQDTYFNESLIEFRDGSLISAPGLIGFKGFEEF